MKTMNQYLISFVLLFTFVNKVISGGSDWMANVDGKLKLNQINIPGTHDSATYSVNKFETFFTDRIQDSQTQDKSIMEQLEIGVRYFDIRLANIKGTDDILISHSGIDCGISFKEVLNDCRKFLSDHKTETIIIHLKNERDCSESDIGGQYPIAHDCTDKRIEIVNNLTSDCYTKNRMPTLDDIDENNKGVRGKIVIATREKDYNGIRITIPYDPEKIDYNYEGCAFNSNYECRTQDGFKLPLEDKWNAIETLISQQKNVFQGDPLGENILAINFMSTSNGDLEDVANEINSRLVNEESIYAILDPGRQYGWIIADFINEKVAEYIYKSNRNSINEIIEEEYAINSEENIFTEEQVKHLYNGDEAHDRCIRKIKDVVWYRSQKSNIKVHLNMQNIVKYCNRFYCAKAYAPEGTCESKKDYWNTCRTNIIGELTQWIFDSWKVKNINYC